MPNALGFNILGADRMCIEVGCKAGGPVWVWNEEKQKKHFLEHHPVIYSHSMENIHIHMGDNTKLMERRCRVCGDTFYQERKRGRPRVFCDIHMKRVENYE